MQILFRNKKGMQANNRALLMTKNEKVKIATPPIPPSLHPDLTRTVGLSPIFSGRSFELWIWSNKEFYGIWIVFVPFWKTLKSCSVIGAKDSLSFFINASSSSLLFTNLIVFKLILSTMPASPSTKNFRRQNHHQVMPESWTQLSFIIYIYPANNSWEFQIRTRPTVQKNIRYTN